MRAHGSRHSHTATPRICAASHQRGRQAGRRRRLPRLHPHPGRFVSVMWRPFLFRRPHRFRCLCRLDPLRERIEPRPQRLNLQALPIYDIAQFDVGALEERYFRFQPLDHFAVHFYSVTARGRNRGFARTGGNRNQTGGNPVPSGRRETRFQASPVPCDRLEMPVFTAPRCISNIATKLVASLAGDVFTCRDRATTVRFGPLACYGENRDYGQHQDLAASASVHS